MTNRWFLQSKIAKTPLLITYTTAASFDHYYIGTDRESTTTTIPVLNTNLFQNRQMGTNNYYIKKLGSDTVWLWATHEHLTVETQQPKQKDLISLSNCKYYRAGQSYNEANIHPPTLHGAIWNWQYYKQHIQDFAGNPFHKDFLNHDPDQITILTKVANSASECLDDNEVGKKLCNST